MTSPAFVCCSCAEGVIELVDAIGEVSECTRYRALHERVIAAAAEPATRTEKT
jgi:hypothetical protein